MGFNATQTVIITTSRLVEKNAVGDLLQALALLPAQFVLAIAGDGPLGGLLKSQAQKLGVKDRVSFLGYLKRTDVPALLHASDIFSRPSLSEGLGNSFLEAMAARVPVVATPVGGIPDFLFDGKTGFLCKPHDPHSIAEAVTKISALAGESKREILDRAQEMVKAKYNWDTIARDMSALFNVIAKHQ